LYPHRPFRRLAMRTLASLLLAGALAAGLPSPAAAGGGSGGLGQRVRSAATTTDHAGVAAEYDRLASEAKDRAAAHRRMETQYAKAGGAITEKYELDRHCRKLAESYERSAAEYAALATAHREMAAGAK
jgi:hypothetical protein